MKTLQTDAKGCGSKRPESSRSDAEEAAETEAKKKKAEKME